MTTVMSIVGINGATGSVAQQHMADNYQFSIEAMNNAEAGIAVAIIQLNDGLLAANGFDDELDPNGDGDTSDGLRFIAANLNTNTFFDVILLDDDDGDGDPSVDSNGVVRLISQGISDIGSTRTIAIRISAVVAAAAGTSLDAAIMVEGDLEISGNPTQCGTNQDIHSNSDIVLSGDPVTSGVVSAVGTVSGTPEGGGTTESGADRIDLPEIDPADFAQYAEYTFYSDNDIHNVGDIYDADGTFVDNADGDSWNGWKFAGDKWDTDGDNVQGGFLYFTGEYANIVVGSNPGSAGTPWEVTILADGYIEISGNPYIANYRDPDHPPAIQDLMLVAGTDIKINGNPIQSYNGIIAAAEQIDVSGNPAIEGVLLSGDQSNDSEMVTENKISGNMTLCYGGGYSYPDVSSDDDGKVQRLSWQDVEISRDSGVFSSEIS